LKRLSLEVAKFGRQAVTHVDRSRRSGAPDAPPVQLYAVLLGAYERAAANLAHGETAALGFRIGARHGPNRYAELVCQLAMGGQLVAARQVSIADVTLECVGNSQVLLAAGWYDRIPNCHGDNIVQTPLKLSNTYYV